MTQNELRQIPWLQRERDAQLAMLKEATPREGREVSLFGRLLTRQEREVFRQDRALQDQAYQIIAQGIERYLKDVELLTSFIYQIEESDVRLILIKRYIQGKSWQAVALETGALDEGAPRKKLCRYLEKRKKRERREEI